MTKKTLVLSVLQCIVVYVFSQSSILQNHPVSASATPRAVKFSTINNTIYADFAPTRYGDRIYYTSSYQESKQDKPVTRIYSFIPGEKATLDATLNPKKGTSFISNASLAFDARRIYYTICKDETQDHCEIWYRDREYEGSWSVAKKLPDFINLNSFTATQPSVGWDASLKKFVLYFVSNRPGGKGNKDIWCSSITWDGNFETPYPLPFNTPADDVTPFFDQSFQSLYFSTNGLKGHGRFDVYRTTKIKTEWSNPENVGPGINSAYDDLYFSLHEPSQIAYFSSDRPGSICNGGIEGWNCYDIYAIRMSEKVISKRKSDPPSNKAVSSEPGE
jgi:hypothetical protein